MEFRVYGEWAEIMIVVLHVAQIATPIFLLLIFEKLSRMKQVQ